MNYDDAGFRSSLSITVANSAQMFHQWEQRTGLVDAWPWSIYCRLDIGALPSLLVHHHSGVVWIELRDIVRLWRQLVSPSILSSFALAIFASTLAILKPAPCSLCLTRPRRSLQETICKRWVSTKRSTCATFSCLNA